MSNSIKCPIIIEGKAECGQAVKRKGLPSRPDRPPIYHCECVAGHKFHQKLSGKWEPCDCLESAY